MVRLRRERFLAGVAAVELLVVLAIRVAYGGGGIVETVAGLVLAPVMVVLVGLNGRRLAGDGFGRAAAVVAVLLPPAGAVYALPVYRSTYTHHALPSLVGLDHSAWFALGVAIAAAALVAPTLALAGAGAVAGAAAIGVWGTSSLVDVKNALHENAWSVSFSEWLVIAGAVGVAFRSVTTMVWLVGWLGFFVLRAAHEPFATGQFWEALAPAVPSAALLVAAIGLLVPRHLRAALRRPADAR
jgi:hypothetical protein